MKKNPSANIQIRKEQIQDIAGIRKVNMAAFESSGEADVIDQLRISSPIFISLVAIDEAKVVGHILFTPLYIADHQNLRVHGLGLGPLAVLPEYQGWGIGSKLCRTGLEVISQNNVPFVVVLGHPSYYPRFGFEPASKFGIVCAYEGIPEPAFMIHIFDWGIMEGVSGTACYRQEFNNVI